MNVFKTKSFLKLAVGLLIIGCFQVNAYCLWTINYSEVAYNQNGDTGTALKPLIAKGATYFLDAYASTLQYMQKTESASFVEVNPVELKTILAHALESMRLANDHYADLKALAEITPYNAAAVTMLKMFDYEGFVKNNSGYVNQEMFDEVKSYLIAGDIRGLYAKMHSDSLQITALLTRLIDAVNAGAIPATTETWQLNHRFSQSLLFGQYTAQVCEAISKTLN
ncbi:MAG: hypothetical protein ACM3SY_18755 [Candidatus Omnitrophota bacterium]